MLEFQEQKWGAGMKAEYRNETYFIATVNFRESLIGLVKEGDDLSYDNVSWVRCENCKVLPEEKVETKQEEIKYDWGISNVNQ